MKLFRNILLGLFITTGIAYAANEWHMPSNAIFTGTVTNTQLNATGIVTNTSGGLLGTVNPVPVTKGGTGVQTATTNGVIYGNGTSAVGVTGAGTQYQVFQAGASSVPTVGALHLDQSAAVTGILPNANTTAASTNTVSAIVTRDGSGNFAAGTITASLTGAASLNVLKSGDTMTGTLNVINGADTKNIALKEFSGQTSDLLNAQNSSGTVLYKIDSGGNETATSFIGPVTGAASLNVLKAGDTMTGILSTGSTAAGIGILNNTGGIQFASNPVVNGFASFALNGNTTYTILNAPGSTGTLYFRANNGTLGTAVGGTGWTFNTASTTNSSTFYGSEMHNYVAKTANYSVDNSASDFLIGMGSTATHTITLPVPTSGRVLYFKDNTGAAASNNITINPHASETIDGNASAKINTNYGSTALFSDGSNWFTFGGGGSFVSPLTTKGDVHGYSTTDIRIPVGANGQHLIADSNNTNGVRYKDTTPKNYVLNSDAEVDTSGWTAYNDAQTYTVTSASPAVFTVASTTGWYVGMPVTLNVVGGSLATGLSANANYYVSVIGSSTTFQLASSLGGASVNTSSTGSATQTVYPYLPVTLTSGSNAALTFSRTTSSPLSGVGSLSLVYLNPGTAPATGSGVYYPFTIDSADEAKVLSVSFDFNATTTFTAADGITAPTFGNTAGDSDLEVFIYDVTNATLIPVSPRVITANGTNNFTFKGVFQTNSNSTSYRLAIHHTRRDSAYTFIWDNVYVGRQNQVQGSPITDWAAYTPTITGMGTVASLKAYYRREGDSLHVHGAFTSGTTSAVATSITLPSGLAVDYTKISTTTNQQHVGSWYNEDTGNAIPAAATGGFAMFVDGSTTGIVYVSGGSTSAQFTKTNGSSLGTSSVGQSFDFTVPISGWSSTLQMSNDTDTRVVAARMTGATATVTSSYSDVTWTTIVNDNNGAMGAISYTVPVSGYYDISGQIFFGQSTISAGNTLQEELLKNGSAVEETRYISEGSNSSSVGVPFNFHSILANAGDTFKIQVLSGAGTPVITSSATNNYLSIKRQSGPATIAATDSVSARYYASSTSLSGSLATISWTTKDWDTHGAMSSGTYTIPTAGKYQINARIAVAGTATLNTTLDMQLQKNGSVVSEDKEFDGAATTNMSAGVNDEVQCLAGDTIIVQVSSSATTPTVVSSNSRNYFSIVRVGN